MPKDKKERAEALLAEHMVATDQIKIDDGQDAEDIYVAGETPEKAEEKQAADMSMFQRLMDKLSSMERNQERLVEQVNANREMVEKLSRDGHGLNRIAGEALEAEQNRFQEARYEAIRNKGGYVTIQIHTHEDPNRNHPVPVGVDGDKILIARGIPTTISVKHLEVLDRARVTTHVKEVDGAGNPLLRKYDYLQYPYTILDDHAAAVIETRKVA